MECFTEGGVIFGNEIQQYIHWCVVCSRKKCLSGAREVVKLYGGGRENVFLSSSRIYFTNRDAGMSPSITSMQTVTLVICACHDRE